MNRCPHCQKDKSTHVNGVCPPFVSGSSVCSSRANVESVIDSIREASGGAWDGVDIDQELAAIRGTPQGTEARVCDDIAERQALGIGKYGGTVSQSTAPLRDWLQHAYEECLDQAVYLKRAIEELDAK